MKESIGGISLFQIVVLFILLFTGIMCLTINHSRAFGVKDEILTIIQNEKVPSYKPKNKYELTKETINSITEYLKQVGYRQTGNCPNGWLGYTREGSQVTKNASYCVKASKVTDDFYYDLAEKCKNGKCTITSDDFPSMVYYEVLLFYQLDIPIINYLFKFEVKGSTKVLFG